MSLTVGSVLEFLQGPDAPPREAFFALCVNEFAYANMTEVVFEEDQDGPGMVLFRIDEESEIMDALDNSADRAVFSDRAVSQLRATADRLSAAGERLIRRADEIEKLFDLGKGRESTSIDDAITSISTILADLPSKDRQHVWEMVEPEDCYGHEEESETGE